MPESDFQSEPPDRLPRRPRDENEDDSAGSDRRRRSRRPRQEDDYDDDYERESSGEDAVQVLIPYKNPLALASYYCGVFSLIPCFTPLLGPAAIILGVLGLRKSRREKKARGAGHAITGMVLGSLTTLAAVVLISLVIVIPLVQSH